MSGGFPVGGMENEPPPHPPLFHAHVETGSKNTKKNRKVGIELDNGEKDQGNGREKG